MLTQRGARVGLDLVLVARHGRGERMVEERPVAGVLVALEEREVDHPVEDLRPGFGEVELAAEVRAQAAEDTRHECLVAGGEEHRRAGLGGERGQLVFGEELRDRRACLARLVVHEVREPLRPPLLRDLLEPRELRTGERPRRNEVAHDGAPAKTPNCESRVIAVASWISTPKRRSGLSLP